MLSSSTDSATQLSLTDLADSLSHVTFVVVDLETTGGSPARDTICEIGAVKVRGGEVHSEFSSLINPQRPIPAAITNLTGITNAAVTNAPNLRSVLPAFLEFAQGSVLVAHNAPFDIGFLRKAAAVLEFPWPSPPVIDTVRLARRVFSRSEMPSVRLSVLAARLGARVTPHHRALADARATADVLHSLLERLGSFGIESLEDLRTAQKHLDPEVRNKKYLAQDMPRSPGVYIFRGAQDEVLYVGTAQNLRQRTHSYFTSSQTRGRIRQMVLLAHQLDHVVCATALEAHIREQRLIAARQPPYNRRSRQPNKQYWINVIAGQQPNISISRTPSTVTASSLGPIRGMKTAQTIRAALRAIMPEIRSAKTRSAKTRSAETKPTETRLAKTKLAEEWQQFCSAFAALTAGENDELLHKLATRVAAASDAGHFMTAASARDELATAIDALIAHQRLHAIQTISEFIAAASDGDGGWEISVVRYGRLAAAGVAPRGVNPLEMVELLRTAAETVLEPQIATRAASAEETRTLLRWVEQPSVRIVDISTPWSVPVLPGAHWREFAQKAALAREGALARAGGSGATISSGGITPHQQRSP